MNMKSGKFLKFKSLVQFDNLFKGEKIPKDEIFIDDNDKKKLLFQSKQVSPFEEAIKSIENVLHLTKRNYNELNNKKLLYQIEDDINRIKNILDKNNEDLEDSSKISFLNIICYILKKINKKSVENELLKIFFLDFEKLVHLFLPLNVNINDIMTKLVGQIKYEKKGKNRILFKEGDKGDKFYIILKGEIGILIPQEKIINCCPTEYLKYLINLYLYQEKSLINKLLLANRDTLKFDERIFYALMSGLKFYHFFIYYSGTRKSYKSPIDFLHKEYRINNYLRQKNDFSPEQAFHTLNLSNISEKIYEYYSRFMDDMNTTFLTSLNDGKRRSNIYSLNSATNLKEFGEFVKEYEHDKKKLQEYEFFDKLYHVTEVNTKFTMTCTTDEYIRRINCEIKLKEIESDIRNNIIKINEKNIDLKYFNYIEVNQLKDKNIFGELALINPNQKRTATIIIKENCHFGILDKESYQTSIRTAQEKSRMRNLLFFTNGFIFKGITNNYFLNNFFFRLKKRSFNPGEFLFRRGEKRTKIYFIINGELQLGGKMTLKKITEILGILNGGTGWDNGGIIPKYCKESADFIKFYEEAQNNFRFYVLKNKEIAGLDDMTQDDIYLFDCYANTIEPTEVYEFDYKIYKSCLEEEIVKINNDNYVSAKKKVLIDRLYKQRDTIAHNEFNRIKIYIINKEETLLKKQEEKEKNEIKVEKNFFPLGNTVFHQNTHSFIEDNKISTNIINNENNFRNRDLPSLFSTGNLHYNNQNNKSKFLFGRTEYNDFNSLSPQNRISLIKSIESNNSSINNSFLLLNQDKNKYQKEKEITNLLKSDNLNLSKISKYLNKNNFNFPKLKGNSITKIEKKPLNVFNKFCLNKNNNKTEENKFFSNKKKFKFNNQKIFSFLLNDKNADSKSNINLTLKNDNNITKSCENDKENMINVNDKIINTQINDYKNNYRKKKKVNLSLNDDFINKRKKYIKTSVEEDYENIFLIDCLCLDKWEEKNNKFRKKNKSKLKGKKIFLYQ